MRIRLDIPVSVRQLVRAVNGICPPQKADTVINYVCTDSREIATGDLFFALCGKRSDGHCYIDDAMRRGAICVSHRSVKDAIIVNDTTDALLSFAAYYKTLFPCLKYTVAITGSVGKTTTKNMLASILSSSLSVHATPGNYNNNIGLSASVLSAPRETEAMILEMGMNSRGEIERLSKAAKPTVSVITNIGTAHIGILGSREQIALAKSEIAEGMDGGYILCPHDEELLCGLKNRRTVSVTDSNADYFMQIKRCDLGSTRFDFITPYGEFRDLYAEISGEHNLISLSFAIAAAVTVGMNETDLASGIKSITEEAERARTYSVDDYTVLDDSYNASLESVQAMIKHLKHYPAPHSILLGDILELGSYTEQIHREVGRIVAGSDISKLYLFGVYSPFVRAGAISAGMSDERIYINTDTEAPELTAEQIRINHSPGETILFKGSHALKLSRILELLKREEVP